MEKFREKIDEISLKISIVQNLAELIEDYFDDNDLANKRDFRNKATLSHLSVEKINELHKGVEDLWNLTINFEKR